MGKRFYSNNSSKWCPLTGRFYWVSAFNLYTYGADKLDFLFKAFTRQSLCRRTHNINSFHRVNKPVRSYKTSFIRVCFKDDVISRCVSFHLCVCMTWGLSLQYVAVKGSNQMGAKLTGAERSWRLCENFRNIFRIVFLFFLSSLRLFRLRDHFSLSSEHGYKKLKKNPFCLYFHTAHSPTLMYSFCFILRLVWRVKHFGKCVLPTTVILSG